MPLRLTTVCLTAALVFASLACTRPVAPGGELRVGIATEPATLDPQKVDFHSEIGHAALVFEGLMAFDARTLAPVPAAAAAFPDVSADGRSYTFTLRSGLTYSDGTPLRAEDFAYAYRRACDPATLGNYAFWLDAIVGCADWRELRPGTGAPAPRLGIETLSESRIRFTLREPAAYFPAVTALWIGYPVRAADVGKGAEWWRDPASYIGNGPFRLASWTRGERLEFERNDRFRERTHLRKVTTVVTSGDHALRRYRANELDIITISPELAEQAADLRDELVDAPRACTSFVAFNVRQPPFDSREARLALAKALDRDAFVRDVQKLGSPATGGFIPHGVPGHDANDTVQRFDPAAARDALAAAPAPARAALRTLTFAYSDSPVRGTQVRWLVAQWRDHLGIDVLPEPLDRTAYTRRLNEGWYVDSARYPRLYFETWCAEYPDVQQWLSSDIFYPAVVTSRTGYTNAALANRLRAAERAADPVARAATYADASRALSADAAAAWLAYGGTRYAKKPWVRGMTFTAFDHLPGVYSLRETQIAAR